MGHPRSRSSFSDQGVGVWRVVRPIHTGGRRSRGAGDAGRGRSRQLRGRLLQDRSRKRKPWGGVRRSPRARRWGLARRSVPLRRSTWTSSVSRRRSRTMRRPRSRRRSQGRRRGCSCGLVSVGMWSCPSARRCIPEATPGRPISVATPLFHLEMLVCKACRQSAAPGRLSREPPLVVRRRDTMAFETAIAQTGSGTE